ncbi:MAG: hypothetical protein OEW34_09975 [Burkholderiaceae bacterium]|jgi:hypothetical protein|nr:hypothetical protein [Burkholderiaceae bacterium]
MTMGRNREVPSQAAGRAIRVAAALAFVLAAAGAGAEEPRNLAPGFTALPQNAKILVAPIDVELYSISAGGVPEPRADWTSTALGNMKKELGRLRERYKGETVDLDERAADDFGELLALHSAVARSISLHHAVGGMWALPTKNGKLDWSLGDALKPLQDKTGARYALFIWVRDSYASGERVAAMVLMAALGVGLGGGVQQGYASLVDLETGRVLWFNRLARASGDLREPAKAAETVDALLLGFPGAK